MSYGVFGGFIAQPGKRDELLAHLLRAAASLNSNPHCLQYIVAKGAEAETVYVFEIWTDESAHQASLNDEEVRSLIEQARPLISGLSDRTELAVEGGKGLQT